VSAADNDALTAGFRARSALIADRDSITRRAYAALFAQHDWQSEETDDGREALAKAVAHLPRVVVVDARLPGINGYELCTLLHRDPLTSGIAVVLTTDDPASSTLERAKSAEADAVLVKPCFSRLFPTIEQFDWHNDEVLGRSHRLTDRSDVVRERVAQYLARAAAPVEYARMLREGVKRLTLKAALRRGDTMSPPLPPPILVCPECDRPLTYKRSHIGGVNERLKEQWDYFVCPGGHGTFQYRARTRKLRKIP